jgi:hypothetical protein
MNLDQMAQDSYNSSKALENQFATQANQYTDQYNQAYGNAQNAQNDLSNFTKNMVSGDNAYQQQLAKANTNAGYDVNNLNAAQNQVSQVQGIMGGLPRAVQAQNANYGATAGDVAGQYSTEAQNLNQTLGLANQNAQNQLAKMNAGLTGAQQGTQAVMQGQDQQRQSYEATAANAVNIMHETQGTMTFFKNLLAQQGSLTAQQQNFYAQAKASYAAAQQSYAQAAAASAQARSTNQQTDYAAEQHQKMLAQQSQAQPQQTARALSASASAPLDDKAAAYQAWNNSNGWDKVFSAVPMAFKYGW